MERIPHPQHTIEIPGDILGTMARTIEDNDMDALIQHGRQRMLDAGLESFVMQTAEDTRKYDPKSGLDVNDPGPEAFVNGQLFALMLAESWFDHDELAYMRPQAHQIAKQVNISVCGHSPNPYENASLRGYKWQNLGALGLSRATNLGEFIDNFIEDIEFDMDLHNNVKYGAGLMMYVLLTLREGQIYSLIEDLRSGAVDPDYELAKLTREFNDGR